MTVFDAGKIGRMFFLHLDKGDDITEALKSFIEEYGIQNAAVISGIASLRRLRYHYINSLEDLPENVFRETTQPLEVGAIQGLIIDGVPHLHLAASHIDEAYIGHLEPGCEVQYLAELCVMEVLGAELTRKPDEFGVYHLQAKNS